MRRFLIYISTVSAAAIVILLAIRWVEVSHLRRVNLYQGDDIHIIAIGPSTTGCALNDNHFPGFRNLSRNGTSHSLLVNLLPRILEANPQIDTVLIDHGRFEFTMMFKQRYVEMQDYRDKLPLFFFDIENTNWEPLLTDHNFYCALLNPDFFKTLGTGLNSLSGFKLNYIPLKRDNLLNPKSEWSIDWYEKRYNSRGNKNYSKEWILKNCADNDHSVRRAIKICKERGVVPVLFFTPLYQYDRWVDWSGFCDYLSDYDHDILIADYDGFEFPDESYYGDVHHLNSKGADYFTSHIASHGLKTVTVGEWLKAHGH